MPRAFDDNGSFGDAQYIGKLGSDLDISGNVGGDRYYGGIGSFYTDRYDYFLFEVASRRNVAINSDEADVTVRLYDDRRRYLGRLDDDSYGGDYAQERGYSEGLAFSLSRGFYYLRISSDDFADYEIDFDAARDDNFRLDDARSLGTIDCSQRVRGQVGSLDFGDTYRFQPGRAGRFVLSQADNGSSRRNSQIRLYDDDGDLIETGFGRVQENLDDDQDYYVRVAAEDAAASQDYTLTLIPNPIYQGTQQSDRLKGCADDERFRGLAGDDVLIGQQGTDQLAGGAGDDRLEGGSGDDRLKGGKDFDILFGGPGRDVFALLGNNNADRIRDFQPGLDRLDLPVQIPFSSLSLIQAGQNTLVRTNAGVPLATLTGISATRLSAADFV
jgi:Ca2+-binding RTX toxin-like protein